jgi:hypothetical protein
MRQLTVDAACAAVGYLSLPYSAGMVFLSQQKTLPSKDATRHAECYINQGLPVKLGFLTCWLGLFGPVT